MVEVWNEIDNLGRQREQMRVLGDYRELYLDRSRALYELNAATDLGDAMVQVTDARLRSADTDYRLAQAWARLQALSGALVAQPAAGDSGDGRITSYNVCYTKLLRAGPGAGSGAPAGAGRRRPRFAAPGGTGLPMAPLKPRDIPNVISYNFV